VAPPDFAPQPGIQLATSPLLARHQPTIAAVRAVVGVQATGSSWFLRQRSLRGQWRHRRTVLGIISGRGPVSPRQKQCIWPIKFKIIYKCRPILMERPGLVGLSRSASAWREQRRRRRSAEGAEAAAATATVLCGVSRGGGGSSSDPWGAETALAPIEGKRSGCVCLFLLTRNSLFYTQSRDQTDLRKPESGMWVIKPLSSRGPITAP
jgi:hypothetical protein